jgi:hypothetical protein
MRSRRALFLAIGLFCSATSPAWSERAEQPAAARPRYGAGLGLASGTVFFLATEAGTVAVGAAHSFDVAKLAASDAITFERGRTRERVGESARVLVGPGAAFSAEGGTLRTDVVVFALDAPPRAARVLQAGAASKGMRVVVLGLPGAAPVDEQAIAGRVRTPGEDALVVELEGFHDLRGWGGAPIVDRETGSVVGFVQAAQPDGRDLRVLATPIAAVVDALRTPHERGRGRSLASLGAGAPPDEPMGPPAPTPTPADTARAPVRQTGPLQPVRLVIDHPDAAAVFGGEPGAFVAGRALVPRNAGITTDVVFVLDVSSSTRAPSGADVNGNGIVGAAPSSDPTDLFALGATDPGDSILAAEVAAVRRLVARLDPRYTRVSLVTFAGGILEAGVLDEDQAQTELALTTAYEDLQRALDRVLLRGADGATNMAAGVDQATRELLGLRGAFSQVDPRSQKIVVFLTDGVPTLPFPGDDARNVRSVREAAARAHKAGARVFPYGIGAEALAGPLALVDLAQATDAIFTPVRDPSRLSDIFADVEFADIESIEARNVTLGAPAHAVEVGADGSFGAWLPLAAGRNEIEVVARASDGRIATQRITLQYAPDAPVPDVPPALLGRRSRLLELHLAGLRRLRIETEQGEVDRLRQQLRIEVERERAKAEDRAARQRKELEIEVERAAPEESAAE